MAPERDPSERRRRSAAIGAALLLLLVAVAVVVLGGSDDGTDRDAASVPQQAPPPAAKRIANRAIGATLRRPDGWRARVAGPILTLRSNDRSTAIVVRAPKGATRSAALLRTGVGSARAQLRGAMVGPGDGRRIAGLPTISAVVRGTNVNGSSVSVLVAAAQGRRRAWLIEVLSAPDRRGGSGLVEAQVALGSLKLSG